MDECNSTVDLKDSKLKTIIFADIIIEMDGIFLLYIFDKFYLFLRKRI